MLRKEIEITNKTGLHARPAAEFVKEAAKFTSAVTIEFKGKKLNAKSILHVLSAGIAAGSTIVLTTDGEDEAAALESLTELVVNFKE
jgi:phosphotransferase system HPr (HPr) family protein